MTETTRRVQSTEFNRVGLGFHKGRLWFPTPPGLPGHGGHSRGQLRSDDGVGRGSQMKLAAKAVWSASPSGRPRLEVQDQYVCSLAAPGESVQALSLSSCG